MPENKQNTENKDANSDNKTTTGSAASLRQAKDENTAVNNPNANKMNNPTDSSIGKNAPLSSSAPAPNNAPNNAPNSAPEKPAESVSAITAGAVEQAKDKAGSVLGEQKTNLASGITSVADSIRQVGENISHSNENNQVAALAGKYGDTLAQQVEKFSSYIDDKEIKELVRDVEQFAKRNPLMFVGGALALGILAARFLKSSSSQNSGRRGGRNNRSGN